MRQLSIFLIVTICIISAAVYFHYNREQQVFSKTLFGGIDGVNHINRISTHEQYR